MVYEKQEKLLNIQNVKFLLEKYYDENEFNLPSNS